MTTWYYEDGNTIVGISTSHAPIMDLDTLNYTINKMNEMSHTIGTLEDQADWNAVMAALLARKKQLDEMNVEPGRPAEKTNIGGKKRRTTNSSRVRRRSKTRRFRRGVGGGR